MSVSAPQLLVFPSDEYEQPDTDATELQAQICLEAWSAQLPLPHLMTWVLDRRNLQAACMKVSSTDGANTPGSDGETLTTSAIGSATGWGCWPMICIRDVTSPGRFAG